MDLDIFGDTGDQAQAHQGWSDPGNSAGVKIGSLDNILFGPLRGAAHGVSGAAKIAAGLLNDNVWNPTYAEAFQHSLYGFSDYIDKEIIAPLTPAPGAVGLASSILGGAAELPGGLLIGGPAGLAVTSAINAGTGLVDQGVDPTTATLAGIGTGATNAAMMALPQAGETLKQTVGLMAGMPVLGAASRFATAQGLEAAGYPEQAKSFAWNDPAAMGTDLAMSLVFGGLGYHGQKLNREAKAKVADLANRWQEVQDALPVEVVDSAHVMGSWFKALESNPHNAAVRGAVEVHLNALDKALSDLQAGRPVDIAQEVKSLFGPDYRTPTAEAFRGMLRDVWKLDEEQTDVTLSMVNAFARYKGEHLDDYINRTFAGGEGREPITRDALRQHQVMTPEVLQQYREFLYNPEFSGKTGHFAESERELLLKAAADFPLGTIITNRLGESISLTPPSGHSVAEYIHHFLTKHDRESNTDKVSSKYLKLLPEITDTLNNYEERFLGASNNQDRIYYVKSSATVKDPYHVVVVSTDGQGNLLGWTHFSARETYRQKFIKEEQQLIEARGVIDKAGKQIALNYQGYLEESRKQPLYLGNDALKGSQQPQESRSSSSESIVPVEEFPVKPETVLHQGERGAVSFLNDGRAILHALKNPDISTVMHELAHVWRRQLDPEDLAVVAEFYADPRGRWDRVAEEKFSRAFEKYLGDGKAPSEELQGVFEKLKTWIVDIYRGIVGTPLEAQVPNKVRAVFDKMLTREINPEEAAFRAEAAKILEAEAAAARAEEGGDPHGQKEEGRQGLLDQGAGAARPGAERPAPGTSDWLPEEASPDVLEPLPVTPRGPARGAFSPESDTLVEAIAKLGGIDKAQALEQWGATLVEGAKGGGKNIYRKGGQTIEAMTESLAEHGYLPRDEHGKPVVGALEDALARSMAGEDVLSTKATDQGMQRRAATAEAEQARRTGPDAELSDAEYQALSDRLAAEDAADPLSRSINTLLDQWGDITYTETVDGQERQVSAREVLDRARRDVENAKGQRDVYEAAATCLYL